MSTPVLLFLSRDERRIYQKSAAVYDIKINTWGNVSGDRIHLIASGCFVIAITEKAYEAHHSICPNNTSGVIGM